MNKVMILTAEGSVQQAFAFSPKGLSAAATFLLEQAKTAPDGVVCHVLQQSRMTRQRVIEALMDEYACEVSARGCYYVLMIVNQEG